MSDKSIQSLLEKDLHNAESLAALLLSERDQLASRDIDALNKTLMEKAQLLAAIEGNDDSRRKMLASFGRSADNNSLRDYCDKAGFGTLYEALQRRLKTCADLRGHSAPQQAEQSPCAGYHAGQIGANQCLHQPGWDQQTDSNPGHCEGLTTKRRVNGTKRRTRPLLLRRR